MSVQLPSPDGANRARSSFVLGLHLRRLFDSVGFVPDAECVIGQPGSYHGTVRCGGRTFAGAVTYFASEVMSKFDDAKAESKALKTSTALERFTQAEELCAETNARFARYFLGHRPQNEDVARVMLRAREKIGRLMSQVNWDRVRSGQTFTRGSSVTLSRKNGSPIHKYSTTVETTIDNFSTLSDEIRQIPLWWRALAEGSVLVCAGNKLAFVNKNYKTFRVIAGEPSGNMYSQKGVARGDEESP